MSGLNFLHSNQNEAASSLAGAHVLTDEEIDLIGGGNFWHILGAAFIAVGTFLETL